MLIGLIIGAVWALAGIEGALITAGMGAVGLLVGLVLSQGLDLSELIGRRDEE